MDQLLNEMTQSLIKTVETFLILMLILITVVVSSIEYIDHKCNYDKYKKKFSAEVVKLRCLNRLSKDNVNDKNKENRYQFYKGGRQQWTKQLSLQINVCNCCESISNIQYDDTTNV
ncbi:hypothetical protein T10_13144 [Trichinella papuae]|uniref:Uncharacterized protein n=1 Tax=Trichinella papuae TaxID=268474 RepID=A0A0V1MJD9_9BILA|nr:hypothetical protein T10_13144 [Trichinella papuae]